MTTSSLNQWGKLVLVLLVFLTTLILHPIRTHAYPDGLLDGKQMNHSTDFNTVGTKTSLITDRNESNSITLSASNTGNDTVWYEFAEPMDINGYMVRSNASVSAQELRLYVVLSSGAQGGWYPQSVSGSSGGVIYENPGYRNVVKVALVNRSSSSRNILEFDVYGQVTDLTAPAIPTGLTGTTTYDSVVLDWGDNTESDLKGYNVFQDGVKITPTPITASTHTVTGLSSGTAYAFTVSSIDTSNNESSKTTALEVTLPTPPEPVTVNLMRGLNTSMGAVSVMNYNKPKTEIVESLLPYSYSVLHPSGNENK